MESNPDKRTKKYDKEMIIYRKHPNYDVIKELYVENNVKSIASAKAILNKIKITNKGQVFKTSTNAQEKLKKKTDDYKRSKHVVKKTSQRFRNVAEVSEIELDKKVAYGYGWDEVEQEFKPTIMKELERLLNVYGSLKVSFVLDVTFERVIDFNKVEAPVRFHSGSKGDLGVVLNKARFKEIVERALNR